MNLQHTTHLPRKRAPLLWVTATAILVRLLIIVSYPPIIAGDGADYWHLARVMAQGAFQGNLVYSTGYPFALSFVLMPMQWLWSAAPGLAYRLVLVAQYACGVITVILLYDLLRRMVSPRAALIGGLISALSPVEAAWASETRPEFFLSFLLILGLWLLMRIASRPRPTALMFALVGAVAGLTWLVRVNSVIVAPLWCLAVWLWPREQPRRLRIAWIGAFLTTGIIVAGGYLVLVHYPTTGTWKYSYLFGWNLKNHLADAGILFDRANGPASATLIRYDHANLPPELKPPKVTTLASNVDHPIDARLAAVLRSAPEPAQSTAVDFEEKRLYLLLGFRETDALMTRAALETIAAHPIPYVASVAQTMVDYFYRYHEFGSDFILPDEQHLAVLQQGALGFVKVSARETGIGNQGDATHTKAKWAFEQPSWVWLPGIRLLSGYYQVFRFSWVLSPIAILACVVLFLRSPRRRAFVGLCVALVLLWLGAVAFICPPGSRYRTPIEPFMDVFIGAAIAWLFTVVRTALRAGRRS
jgi:hypothetical protein